MIQPDGTGLVHVTDWEDILAATWSPDGSRLLAVHGEGTLRKYSLIVIDVASNAVTQVTPDQLSVVVAPAVAPAPVPFRVGSASTAADTPVAPRTLCGYPFLDNRWQSRTRFGEALGRNRGAKIPRVPSRATVWHLTLARCEVVWCG